MHRLLKIVSYLLLPAKAGVVPHVLLLLLLWIILVSPVKAQEANRVILDTDLSSDVDDVGAVAVLHGLADLGQIQILAMMISSGDPWSGPCLDSLNTSFRRPDIPIGVIKHKAVTHVSKYTEYIAEHYPNDSPADIEMPSATSLYRKVLAGQPAASVTIVSIGYLSNLSELLESGPDEYSTLDGKTLVMDKVNRLVCMGGEFPKGREWNIYQDADAAANVVSNWPTPVIFSGFEIGNKIMTGQALQKAAANHPLREAYRLYNNLTNRQSWDQTAVLLAVHPEGAAYKYLDVSEPGRVHIDSKGNNTWVTLKGGPHRFMISTPKTKDLTSVIDDLMLRATYDSP
ncbi:MAG: nucleoside hydrolase [Proteobacteria bacterium]|nr:nucleoside hydrolase [Pseudomonadota bacterium]